MNNRLIPLLILLTVICTAAISCKDTTSDTSLTCSRCGAYYDSIAELEQSRHSDGDSLACDECGAPYAIMLENDAPPTIGVFFDTDAMSGGILTTKEPLILPKLADITDANIPLRYEYSQEYGGVTYRWVISHTADGTVLLQIDHLKTEQFTLKDKAILTELADSALKHTSDSTAGTVTLTVTYADRTVTRTVDTISEELCTKMNKAEDTARSK